MRKATAFAFTWTCLFESYVSLFNTNFYDETYYLEAANYIDGADQTSEPLNFP